MMGNCSPAHRQDTSAGSWCHSGLQVRNGTGTRRNGWLCVRTYLPFTFLLCLLIKLPLLHAQEPRLEVIYPPVSIERTDGSPSRYSGFRGLLIEQNYVREMYPLLTSVFFDSGSAVIPERYRLFRDSEQTRDFTDTTIPGGTFEKYYHVLNIIGYRMRKHPATIIAIGGGYSMEENSREWEILAGKRVETIQKYLKDIWGISLSRMTLLPSLSHRDSRTAARDPLWAGEDRRAEIRSDAWEIMKPVVQGDVRLYAQSTGIRFRMTDGVDEKLTSNRTIEIRRHGRTLHVWDNIYPYDTITPPYNWDFIGIADSGSMPGDTTPYTAQLVLHMRDGTTRRSKEISIPVEIITNEDKIREKLVEKTVNRYSLPFFKLHGIQPDRVVDRILRELVCANISRRAHIEAIGHTDIGGLKDANRMLSTGRAGGIIALIRRMVPATLLASTKFHGVGEEDPLYPNNLPEGRLYNRQVQVVVVQEVE